MDRHNATILGIIFGGLFIALFAFVAIAMVALDSSDSMPFGNGKDGKGPAIGVLKVIGEIHSSDKAMEYLRKFESDSDIKALLVRIDSPGGAVGPSQEIYAELRRISEKIPVVCSMGSVAASGGYYIAAGCDVIFANAGTLTGSIGVISQLPYLGDIAHKLSFEMETIKAGANKDVGNSFRRMKPEERAMMQALLDQVHERFIADVADGRGMDVEEIRPWADGRVLNGEEALAIGLVDRLGSLNDAIRYAMEKADMDGEPNLRIPGERKNRHWSDLVSEGGEALSKGVVKSLSKSLTGQSASLTQPAMALAPGMAVEE